MASKIDQIIEIQQIEISASYKLIFFDNEIKAMPLDAQLSQPGVVQLSRALEQLQITNEECYQLQLAGPFQHCP